MKMMRLSVKSVVFAAEKIFSEFALLAAIFSMMFAGEIGARAWRGMLYNFRVIYAFGRAYALDAPFDEFVAGLKGGVAAAVDRASANIKSDPRDVFLALLAAYIGFKLAAFLLRLMRKRLLCKRCPGEGPPKEERRPAGRGRTYEQLYDEPDSTAHHR
ncbi:MAG: hypothetical protein JXA24_04025 [Proteobacteria bacterium]|nr:hypothetical protein [Pseudomonadota bacterium]